MLLENKNLIAQLILYLQHKIIGNNNRYERFSILPLLLFGYLKYLVVNEIIFNNASIYFAIDSIVAWITIDDLSIYKVVK